MTLDDHYFCHIIITWHVFLHEHQLIFTAGTDDAVNKFLSRSTHSRRMRYQAQSNSWTVLISYVCLFAVSVKSWHDSKKCAGKTASSIKAEKTSSFYSKPGFLYHCNVVIVCKLNKNTERIYFYREKKLQHVAISLSRVIFASGTNVCYSGK